MKNVNNMKDKIKNFINRSHISFNEESEENYVLILEENYNIIRFYCSSFLAALKLVEILINCNYDCRITCENDGSYEVDVIKETSQRIKKLIDNNLIDNEYFRSEIFI